MPILNSRMLTSTKTKHLGYPASLPLCLIRHWICSPRLSRPRCNGQLILELKVLIKLTTVTVKISQEFPSLSNLSSTCMTNLGAILSQGLRAHARRCKSPIPYMAPVTRALRVLLPLPNRSRGTLSCQCLVSQMAQAQLTQTQARKIPKVPLAKFGPNDDAEAFLTSFERSMAAYRVRCEDWVYLLSPQLTDKALLAYTELHPEKAGSYYHVKMCTYTGIKQT